LRRHLGQVLLRVPGEPGHSGPEDSVIIVASQNVFPGRGELAKFGDLREAGLQVIRGDRGRHRLPPARVVGGCQVGSGTITPNP
jgi:hypothetical protein